MMGLLSVQYVIIAAVLLSFFMSPTIGQLTTGNMSKVMPTICLNMIVKNEAKVIKRLLDSVLPLIDSYCICDTGSTDGTPDLIDAYMRDRGVPGKLLHEPFRDFGHTRSFALRAAIDQMDADYLLLVDADMVLQYPGGIDNDTLLTLKRRLADYDMWYVFQGTPQFYNKNVRLIRNHPGFSYWGVTHEYVEMDKSSTIGTFEPNELFINDIGDGGSKANKFERDIQLLTQGLIDLPNNDRYTFYLANSYRDKGDNIAAIEMYKQRVKLGGWIEEIWESYYNIGKCYMRIGDEANAIYYWMEAHHKHKRRIENLYEIVKYYRRKEMYDLAYMFYQLADYERKSNTYGHSLFFQKDIYDYLLDYELTIVGYYFNRDGHDLMSISMHVLSSPGANYDTLRNVLSNYKFYTWIMEKYAMDLSPNNAALLMHCGDTLAATTATAAEGLVSSTPSLSSLTVGNMTGDMFAVCTRFVNYRVDNHGNYINQDHIVSKNIISIVNATIPNAWVKIDEFALEYDISLDGWYVGLEDVRLWSSPIDNQLYYNANRAVEKNQNSRSMHVEHGRIERGCVRGDSRLHYKHERTIEKNWVLFAPSTTAADNASIHCIYSWSPLVVGIIDVDVNEGSQMFTEIHRTTNVPNFFSFVRGSANGITITSSDDDGTDEIWFLCHLVSYEYRRFYYHLIVVLDGVTLAIKKYTSLWTFHANAKVEYSLGFMPMDRNSSQFLIGYSVNDEETKYMTVLRNILEQKMITY